jgi:hypothetical protein
MDSGLGHSIYTGRSSAFLYLSDPTADQKFDEYFPEEPPVKDPIYLLKRRVKRL